MSKKRANKKGSARKPRKPREPARPRIIDLRDYSSVGRPTKYVPEFARVASTMASGGATDEEIARALGCAVSTLYRWKAEIPEFREAIGGAKQIPITRVERSLYHRSVGYSHEHDEIRANGNKVTIVKTTKHYPPDVGAARLWLNNVDPLHWRPRRDPEPPKPTDEGRDVEELTDADIARRLARIAAEREATAAPTPPAKKRARK